MLGAATTLVVVLGHQWRAAITRNRSVTDEPFQIAGNLFYVGATGVTAFLLTGPGGHVVIDGGYPETAPLIIASIAKLGFDIKDVKVLLNSHAHFDHAGGLRELQQASGAELWISEGDAEMSFPVHHGDRELLAVSICSLTLLPFMKLVEPESYPGIRSDFERSFQTLRSLPADIFLGSHGSFFDMDQKRRERSRAKDPADLFIDRDGYLRYVDGAEERFRKVLADQRQ